MRQHFPSPSGDGSLHTSSAPTQGHPSPGRSAPPRSAAESVRADTLRALPEGVASPSRKVADKQNTQPPRNTLKGDSLPPPQFARHGAHTKPPRTCRNPGGTATYPEYYCSSRCIYPLPRHQGVRALRGRVPCRSKEDNMHLAPQNCIHEGTQKSRRFRRISGIFLEVRPLGLEPRTH